MADKKFDERYRKFRENESVDKPLFSEQRSNVLLVSGSHYNKMGSRFWSRIRDDRGVSNEMKVRLTKNHTQRICKIYENSILTYSPDVSISANNETELQDQKAAELNHSVKEYISRKHKFRSKVRNHCQDYVRIGETFMEIYWDHNLGELKGYEQAVDEETGQPMVDEMGQPVKDEEKPVFTGDFVLKRHFAMNVIRDKDAITMDESPYITIREMVEVEYLKKLVGDDEEKLKLISATRDETFKVFDGSANEYREATNQCMLMKTYYRPCLEYPKGYFYIDTTTGNLFEGELPFGIWPVAYVGFDEIQTQPRHHAIVKVVRPYQAEINRTASKMAEHQMTLGDDKLLVQNGTKISNGGFLPGVRAVQYSGTPPGILQGRSGDQYLGYMQSQITEMYQAVNIPDEVAEKQQNTDPYTQLFQSMKQKKKFVAYAEKFGDFLVEVWEIILALAKEYLDEDALIPMIGRSERVNIAEFKSSDPLCYKIKVEQSVDDIETKMGKQLTINQMLQYVGSNLAKDEIGQLLRLSPYVNEELMFEDLTLNYDTATNDILALDRGQYRPPQMYQDHSYMIRKLTGRMSKSDFEFLPPQIQQLYQRKIDAHNQMKMQEIQQIKQAESELIPTGGYMVTCDFYIQKDPNNPSKVERVRMPSEALQWLIDTLNQQGSIMQTLEPLPLGAQAQIAQGITTQQGPPQMAGPPMMG